LWKYAVSHTSKGVPAPPDVAASQALLTTTVEAYIRIRFLRFGYMAKIRQPHGHPRIMEFSSIPDEKTPS
jgi:hypothetical protein